jgi:hypothetical protein
MQRQLGRLDGILARRARSLSNHPGAVAIARQAAAWSTSRASLRGSPVGGAAFTSAVVSVSPVGAFETESF